MDGWMDILLLLLLHLLFKIAKPPESLSVSGLALFQFCSLPENCPCDMQKWSRQGLVDHSDFLFSFLNQYLTPWALKLIPNTACVFATLLPTTTLILCKYNSKDARRHGIMCFSLWTKVIILLKQLLFSCWSDIILLFLTPTPHHSRLALLVIYPWCWMVDYVPQRPVRGGALSHSATATIHHANLEQEHCTQVYYSVHYYYPLVKNSKKSPANSSGHFLEKEVTDIKWEMGHQWESMEAATGPTSVWAHNFDNPHQSCPTSSVLSPSSRDWARRVAAVWYSTFSFSERGNLQMGFRTLSAKVPAPRPPDWSNMDSNGNNLKVAVWIPTRAWRSCRKKSQGHILKWKSVVIPSFCEMFSFNT